LQSERFGLFAFLQDHFARHHRAQGPAGMVLPSPQPNHASVRGIEKNRNRIVFTDHRADQCQRRMLGRGWRRWRRRDWHDPSRSHGARRRTP
jgi:hypothetical protein